MANLWTILKIQGHQSKSKEPTTILFYILKSGPSKDANPKEKINF